METKTQALQDALKLCVKEMCNYCRNEAIARGLELTCVDGCGAYKIAQAALSAPARNCDLYATATEALKAQDVAFNEDNFKNGECRLGCPGCDDGLIDCKILWLFARAAEEGEGDGR